MSANSGFSRRRFLHSATALGAVIASSWPFLRSARAADITVGFIYVGPRDDYGYSQAHAEGAAAVKAKLEGVTVLEEEKVAETIAVQNSMESMIELDGATLLFPTSFGYFNPHMLKVAGKYPDIQFRHCGGLWKEDEHPQNTGSYFGYIDECQYLNGLAAGYATKANKLGFVAAKPIPQVLRNINAFTLGAKSINPEISTQVIFTGDWLQPVKEAEATNALIDQGVDVMTMHVDSPKVVVETSERRGIYTCGYHANQQPLAPNGYLTGAEWNWESVYIKFVEDARAGKPLANFVRGGLAAGLVKTSPYGEPIGEDARNHGNGIKEKMLADAFVIFKGPMNDNKGNEVIPAGTEHIQTDYWLEEMDWLVEGVIGATS